jgi:hypothetical protein
MLPGRSLAATQRVSSVSGSSAGCSPERDWESLIRGNDSEMSLCPELQKSYQETSV